MLNKFYTKTNYHTNIYELLVTNKSIITNEDRFLLGNESIVTKNKQWAW
jgi:hypothetical protein